MSSSVFFKFKSQKEPSRVTFDGTGITVFDLKREIISMNRLGDGTDFELLVYSEDNNEEYDDDTTIIPRSTSVVAKRKPAVRAGRGGAARYVSGKMPLNAKNSHRVENSVSKPTVQGKGNVLANGISNMNGAQTEEEKIAAMFKLGADQWEQQQLEMANAKPIYRNGQGKGKPRDVPDKPIPPGYVCYRCGEKGHWIQACPTNDDPNWEIKTRVKRTTGIPRSQQRIVEKPSALTNDGTVDDTRPSGVMVNAEGDWVVVDPDKAAWDQYQAKTKISAAAQKAAELGSKELQEKGIECSMDKRLFVEPTKTPCCNATFCKDCIINGLLENDLSCPECNTENVLIDSLMPDEEIAAKVKSYKDEKAAAARREKENSPTAKKEKTNGTSPPIKKETSKSPSISGSHVPSRASTATPTSMANGNTKKRKADSELENEKKRPAQSSGGSQATQKPQSQSCKQEGVNSMSGFPLDMFNNNQMPFANGNFMSQLGMNQMPFAGMNGFMSTPMSMGSMMAMTPGMINPMMSSMTMQANPYQINTWNPMQPYNGYNPQQMNSGYGSSFSNGGYGLPQMPMGNTNNNLQNVRTGGMNGSNGMSVMGGGRGTGNFANQQRNGFSTPTTSQEESPYFRQPVNPHRHQGRRQTSRPTDYREI